MGRGGRGHGEGRNTRINIFGGHRAPLMAPLSAFDWSCRRTHRKSHCETHSAGKQQKKQVLSLQVIDHRPSTIDRMSLRAKGAAKGVGGRRTDVRHPRAATMLTPLKAQIGVVTAERCLLPIGKADIGQHSSSKKHYPTSQRLIYCRRAHDAIKFRKSEV